MRSYLLLALAVLLVFGPSVTAPFHLDDKAIFADRAITSRSGAWEVWRPLQTRPLTYFSFWVNYQLCGTNPVSYHAAGLLLHLSCVLLLYHALVKLIPWQAALTAAGIFAVHPIQSEAVILVFARASLLAALLCLVALVFWLKQRHWWATLSFALALLAKEECVAFPLFLLLLSLTGTRKASDLRTIAAMLGLSLLAGLRVLYATAVFPGSGAGTQAGISPADYFFAQSLVILRYMRLLLIPWGYSIDPEIVMPPRWLGALAWLAIAGAAALAARHYSRVREGFWILGGLILLLPSSSIFPATDLAADRRMYLPMLAFSAAAGLLLLPAKSHVKALPVMAFGLASIMRVQVWRSEEALWREAAAQAPNKVRPRIQLSRALAPQDALPVLMEARRNAPGDARLASELGRVYMELNQPAQALTEFGHALALSPADPGALNNRGMALMLLGQRDAAIRDFQAALHKDSCLFDALYNLEQAGVRTSASGCDLSDGQRRLLEEGGQR